MISKVDAPFPRFDLAGQTALVTGAARGIGRSIALALANAGADVVLGLRQAGTADDLVAQIQGMGRRALPVEMDVLRLDQIGPAVDQGVEAFGRLDILVNNAGLGPSAPAEEVIEENFDLTFDVKNAEGFRAALLNSTIIASAVTALSLVGGHAGRLRLRPTAFPGRGWLILAFMATYMLPPIALILPLYQIMGALGLLDTQFALIIIYSSFVTPFVIWIMRGYISSISSDLDDAARVDGASRLGVLWRVIVPISIPGLLSTALLAFLMAWDEFLYALIMTQTPASKTLPVAINDFIGRHGLDFGLLATGGVIAALPPVIIAFVFQRYIVAGLASGG